MSVLGKLKNTLCSLRCLQLINRSRTGPLQIRVFLSSTLPFSTLVHTLASWLTMRSFNTALLALLAARSNGQQMPIGLLRFNSGATKDNDAAKVQSDFQEEFTTAQNLRGSPGLFNSVRLYTMIQSGTETDPISAFPAAIATNTSMLLGIWCSGTETIENELTAIQNAIDQYGQEFADLVVGISVGSEDLYRLSE